MTSSFIAPQPPPRRKLISRASPTAPASAASSAHPPRTRRPLRCCAFRGALEPEVTRLERADAIAHLCGALEVQRFGGFQHLRAQVFEHLREILRADLPIFVVGIRVSIQLASEAGDR